MAPQRRGVAVALFATAFFLGQALGVMALGAAVAQWGTAGCIALCAVLLLGLSIGVTRALARHQARIAAT